jgi:hypothetical protein
MAYTQQISILEEKLNQLKQFPQNSENMLRTWEIESNLRRLKRLEWEEKYESVKLDDDR